ncbi:SRPBCC family protein [Alkalihalobacillus trypoxylicola]|uniref:Activator of Hsp90 ATPase homologue 1/2-like C-terminal domain-containing protein n=1 Tax=Alkalihalobacillus trypoxylicola TaxID=519424 RepID=A0A161Q242_9BACI|nr:SRPBCC family protein [Alkalihalobacillus trypoxylicola]KYG29603.1 hypothetical protein AZF04_08805 [Alkalihalobacillus trypoxylicola]
MKEIICFTFERHINAPIDTVFSCLNEDEHVLEWNDYIVEHIYEGDESELKEGSTFITKQKIGKKVIELEAEYSAFNPPYYAEVKTSTKEGMSTTKYSLSEESDGTLFKVEAILIPKNAYYSIITKLFKWSFKVLYNEQYEKFIDYTMTIMAMKDRISYDQEHHLGFIHLFSSEFDYEFEKTEELEVNPLINIDLDTIGRIVGIELFENPAKKLKEVSKTNLYIYADNKYSFRLSNEEVANIYKIAGIEFCFADEDFNEFIGFDIVDLSLYPTYELDKLLI